MQRHIVGPIYNPETSCFTNSGTIGRLAIATDDEITRRTTFQKSVAVLKPIKEKIDSRFLYYFLAASTNLLDNAARGAAQKNLLLSELRRLPIKIPPSKQQQQIADVLSAYDELIENNRLRMGLLEEAARLLYREWFVCLRFPAHERIRLVNGLPEAWRKEQLGRWVEIHKGKNITLEAANDGPVPVVAGGLTPAYFHDTANAKSPVVTISASGANAGFVNLYLENIWASDCSFISVDDTLHILFVYFALKQLQGEVFAMQKGAAQPHVYPKDLKRLEIVVPSPKLLDHFKDAVSPMFEQIAILRKQTSLLRGARDLLLPRLMNGEIAV